MKVLFLDIDGVLKPYEYLNTLLNANDKIITYLSEKYQIDYHQYDKWDVLKTYYSWKKEAILRLKNILEITGAKIIISSEWRNFNMPTKMHDLLIIHGLDKYYLDDNIYLSLCSNMHIDYIKKRVLEIQDSLIKYNPKNYVIVDDMKELKIYFPNNFVETYNYLSEENEDECIKILNRNDGKI